MTTTKIYLFNQNTGITDITPSFNFPFKHFAMIKCEFNTNSLGERVVYWIDGNDIPRFFNIDNNKATTLEETSLFFLSCVPNLNLVSVNDNGGALPTGSFQVAIRLFDKEFNLIKGPQILTENLHHKFQNKNQNCLNCSRVSNNFLIEHIFNIFNRLLVFLRAHNCNIN